MTNYTYPTSVVPASGAAHQYGGVLCPVAGHQPVLGCDHGGPVCRLRVQPPHGRHHQGPVELGIVTPQTDTAEHRRTAGRQRHQRQHPLLEHSAHCSDIPQNTAVPPAVRDTRDNIRSWNIAPAAQTYRRTPPYRRPSEIPETTSAPGTQRPLLRHTAEHRRTAGRQRHQRQHPLLEHSVHCSDITQNTAVPPAVRDTRDNIRSWNLAPAAQT